MAKKKDDTQGSEIPEDKTSEGLPEEGKSPETTPDIVDAEYEPIAGASPEAGRTDEQEPAETVDVETVDAEPVADESVLPEEDVGEKAGEEVTGEAPVTDDVIIEDPLTGEEPLIVDAVDPEADTTLDPEPEVETDAEPDPAPPVPTETVIEKTVVQKRGFWPVFIGGVIAAGAGFVAARADLPPNVEASLPAFLRGTDYATPIAALEQSSSTQATQLSETGEQVGTLSGSLDTLSGQVSDIDSRLGALQIPDIAPLEQGISELKDELATVTAGVADATSGVEGLTLRLDALDVRLSTLEKRPIAENLSDEAIAAYERELDGVRRALSDERDTIRQEFDALVAEQGDRMSGIVDDEKARIDGMLADAQAMVDDAKTISAETAKLQEEAAQAQKVAAAQSAVAIVRGALGEGDPYADKLAPITEAGVDIPAALSGPAEDGVPTQGLLLEDFPPAARDALDAARLDDPNSTKGIGAFLKRQLGARSTTPQDGDDTDAILSRAEAALKASDLDTALNELQALPDVAAEKMADWVAKATQRRDALAALDTVAADLNTN